MYVVYLFIQLPLLENKFEVFYKVTFNGGGGKSKYVYLYTS